MLEQAAHVSLDDEKKKEQEIVLAATTLNSIRQLQFFKVDLLKLHVMDHLDSNDLADISITAKGNPKFQIPLKLLFTDEKHSADDNKDKEKSAIWMPMLYVAIFVFVITLFMLLCGNRCKDADRASLLHELDPNSSLGLVDQNDSLSSKQHIEDSADSELPMIPHPTASWWQTTRPMFLKPCAFF